MFAFSTPRGMKNVFTWINKQNNPKWNENKDKLKTCLKIKSIEVCFYIHKAIKECCFALVIRSTVIPPFWN